MIDSIKFYYDGEWKTIFSKSFMKLSPIEQKKLISYLEADLLDFKIAIEKEQENEQTN